MARIAEPIGAFAGRQFAGSAAEQQAEQRINDLGRLVAHVLATSPPEQVLQFVKRICAGEGGRDGAPPASSDTPLQ